MIPAITDTASVVGFATVYRNIGLVIMTIVIVAVAVYALVNVVFSGKAELGSEIELAANRKPYYDDETLEGPKLDRSLSLGLLMLFVLAVALPLYWVMEPARQENSDGDFARKFRERGANMFAATGENEQALNCAGCHGGMDGVGAVVAFNRPLVDGTVEEVTWRAPALNTVLLRYSRAEVEQILVYGRPGSPMPAWGVEGGGAQNEQQIQNLIDYMESIQLSPEEAQAQVAEQLEVAMDAVDEDGAPVFESEGEALFNMGLLDDFAGGAYSCARCHTAGWSYQRVEQVTTGASAADTDAEAGTGTGESAAPAQEAEPGDDEGTEGGGDVAYSRDDVDAVLEIAGGGGGGIGYNLRDGATVRRFPENPDPAEGESPFQDMIDFITIGSEEGVGYGEGGQGSGGMPGSGQRPAEDPLFWISGGEAREFPVEDEGGVVVNSGMLTPEMIEAVVEYERGL